MATTETPPGQTQPTSLTSQLISSLTAPISSLSRPQPLYSPSQVPRIKNAKRLTGTRTKQLIRAAERAHNDPPPPPGLGDCCGSSCDPCVNDLWREELAVWRERWGDAAVEGKIGEGKEGKEGKKCKLPGSYEW